MGLEGLGQWVVRRVRTNSFPDILAANPSQQLGGQGVGRGRSLGVVHHSRLEALSLQGRGSEQPQGPRAWPLSAGSGSHVGGVGSPPQAQPVRAHTPPAGRSPMSLALTATGRRSSVTNFLASRRISMMLFSSANSGARGKEATNKVTKPNWMTAERGSHQPPTREGVPCPRSPGS